MVMKNTFFLYGKDFNEKILARIIPKLCEYFNIKATVHQWKNPLDLIECLKSHHVCLVP